MAPKKLPEFLTAQEQAALLTYVGNRLTYRAGLLNACLIRLMLNNGFRAAELLNLRYHHIDWFTGNAWIREGKGKKDRAVKICRDDLALLREWIDRYGKKFPAAWVFSREDGNRLVDRWLRRMVKRVCAGAGIEKDVHPHTLRHTFGTDYYAATRDLVRLQMVMGHSDIRTTMVYVHLNPSEALDITNEVATKRLSAM